MRHRMACVSAEPLRESADRAVIQVHRAAGNRSEALRQYRIYRALMRNEPGLEPSPAMEQVARSMPIGDEVVMSAG